MTDTEFRRALKAAKRVEVFSACLLDERCRVCDGRYMKISKQEAQKLLNVTGRIDARMNMDGILQIA